MKRIDPTDGKMRDYCDSFRDCICIRCEQEMGKGIGTIECGGEKK